MQSIRQDVTALRRLPGGTALAIVERWPLPLVIRTLGDITLTALRKSPGPGRNPDEDEHDGWQPVRMRRAPLRGVSIVSDPTRARVG